MKTSTNFSGHFNQTIIALVISLFLLFLVLLTLDQTNPLTTKLERDSGIYLYVSNTLTKGELPYIQAWETKPPGIFFINAFALWIGMGTRWGVWLVEFVFLFASAGIGFLFLKKQFGLAPAVIGTGVWLSGLNRVLGGGNITEEYSLLFSFTALLLWIETENKKNILWFDIGIGLCTGFTMLIRPNNLGVQASIVLTILIFSLKDKNYRLLLIRLINIGIAALVPILAASLFFAYREALNEFIEASLLYNLFYTGGNLDLRGSFLGGVASLGSVGGIFILGYFLAVNQIQSNKETSLNSSLVWIVINGALEVILSGLSGKAFGHYFICWLPNVAVSSAYLIFHIFPDFCRWSEKHRINVTLSSILIGLLLFNYIPGRYTDTITQIMYQREKGVQRIDPVADYINTHTDTNDLVLVWGGQAGINFLSKRDAPTPYIFYPLFEASPFTDHVATEYYQGLQQKKPVLIVDGSVFDPEKIVPLTEKSPLQWTKGHRIYANPYLFEVLTFIRQNYSLEEVVNNVPIYRLNQ